MLPKQARGTCRKHIITKHFLQVVDPDCIRKWKILYLLNISLRHMLMSSSLVVFVLLQPTHRRNMSYFFFVSVYVKDTGCNIIYWTLKCIGHTRKLFNTCKLLGCKKKYKIQGGPSARIVRLGWLCSKMFHYLAQLLSHFFQFPISPSRTMQRVEEPESKSTQPNYPSRWTTL